MDVALRAPRTRGSSSRSARRDASARRPRRDSPGRCSSASPGPSAAARPRSRGWLGRARRGRHRRRRVARDVTAPGSPGTMRSRAVRARVPAARRLARSRGARRARVRRPGRARGLEAIVHPLVRPGSSNDRDAATRRRAGRRHRGDQARRGGLRRDLRRGLAGDLRDGGSAATARRPGRLSGGRRAAGAGQAGLVDRLGPLGDADPRHVRRPGAVRRAVDQALATAVAGRAERRRSAELG